MHEEDCIRILKEELVPARGCTEPIAVAFAAATARDVLGRTPESVSIAACPGLVKNILSIRIPGAEALAGMEASAASGLLFGDASKGMEVLEGLTPFREAEVRFWLSSHPVRIALLETTSPLHFIFRAQAGEDKVEVEIRDLHTRIVRLTKNGTDLFRSEDDPGKYAGEWTDRSFLTLGVIDGFARSADPAVLAEILRPQALANRRIAEEGMKGTYGAGIGTILRKRDPSLEGKMKAFTAAASEARMCGCPLPVITNSGSGNQGLATSVPLLVYAEENAVPEETLFRALALANLVTIYQKTAIGRLSAFCGAVSACAGAAAGLTFLTGGTLETIRGAVVDTLAFAAGIVCDGAKATCGPKIATGLSAAFLAWNLARDGKGYPPSTGIIAADADATIGEVGILASQGMKETDKVLIEMMLKR